MAGTVLIVDDHDAQALEIALHTMAGLDVAKVSSAEQALSVVASSAVRGIVTDLNMPGMDGFEFIRKLRSEPAMMDAPIIVISGSADPDIAERVCGLGANAFFSKPYSPALIRETMERLLHEKSDTRSH